MLGGDKIAYEGMQSYYDTFDYPSFWKDRRYEHKSEIIAIKRLLKHIQKLDTVVDIGSGYGRITPLYKNRSQKIILVDPSTSLLKIAKSKFKDKKISVLKSKAENLQDKLQVRFADLVILVRVLHHIDDLDQTFSQIKRILVPNGYLILEFPNKNHLKAKIKAIIRGNFLYSFDTSTKNLCPKCKKSDIAFNNYHPEFIRKKLKKHGFEIIQYLSVSNIRLEFLKRLVPLKFLLALEEKLQTPLAKINFGPSIFMLVKKTG